MNCFPRPRKFWSDSSAVRLCDTTVDGYGPEWARSWSPGRERELHGRISSLAFAQCSSPPAPHNSIPGCGSSALPSEWARSPFGNLGNRLFGPRECRMWISHNSPAVGTRILLSDCISCTVLIATRDHQHIIHCADNGQPRHILNEDAVWGWDVRNQTIYWRLFFLTAAESETFRDTKKEMKILWSVAVLIHHLVRLRGSNQSDTCEVWQCNTLMLQDD